MAQEHRTPGSVLDWRASFALGLITMILGIVISFRPVHALNTVAVLLGVAMIVSGVYQVTRAIGGQEHQRVWRGISGVLFILAGLALIRHLDLSVALIGLFIGFTWIVQGVAALIEGFSGGRRLRGWSLVFALVSLAAGIVVVSAPVSSVSTLTVLLGIWLIVIGLVEVLGALVARREPDEPDGPGGPRHGRVDVPGQRPGAAERDDAWPAAAGEETRAARRDRQ
jgi:uncharacterized membrane protein HdeD (DUF308 family)